MATATFAKGYTVKIDNVSIAKVLDDGLPIPKVTTGEADATTQDSGDWEETVAGRKKGGNCTLKCLWDGDDTGQANVITAWGAATTHTFEVDLPNNGGYWSYTGWISDLGTPVSGKLVGLEATIKVTGTATFSKTKSALTGLTVTGQTLSPTFSATLYEYNCNVAAGTTSVVAVPIQAAAGATITVAGSTVASGGNGTITLGGNGTVTTAKVIVTESSKTPTVYLIRVAKATT
jgi:hypothetical protein